MTALHPLPADALPLRALRLSQPHALRAPRELTPTLAAQLPAHTGYVFTWGQIIEWPGDLPDPDTEAYSGIRWSIIPTSVWQAVTPRVRACRWHLYHLLNHSWQDSAECVEDPLPSFVYIDSPLRVAMVGFTTLSAADAAEARRWLAEAFLIDDLPEALARYEENLLWWIEDFRQPLMDLQKREGDRP